MLGFATQPTQFPTTTLVSARTHPAKRTLRCDTEAPEPRAALTSLLLPSPTAHQTYSPHIEILRDGTRSVRQRHPFTIDDAVVLPDHLPCIWTMPAGDHDYSTRWALIEAGFSCALPKQERISTARQHKRERGHIATTVFLEHLIRDDRDLRHHVNCFHHNSVKLGYVVNASKWPYSSFHQFVKKNVLPENWAAAMLIAASPYGE